MAKRDEEGGRHNNGNNSNGWHTNGIQLIITTSIWHIHPFQKVCASCQQSNKKNGLTDEKILMRLLLSAVEWDVCLRHCSVFCHPAVVLCWMGWEMHCCFVVGHSNCMARQNVSANEDCIITKNEWMCAAQIGKADFAAFGTHI